MSETVAVPVTRMATVELLGRMRHLYPDGFWVDRPFPQLKPGDMLVLRRLDEPGMPFRSGFCCVAKVYAGQRIVTREAVGATVPAVCPDDYVYLVAP